MVSTKELKNIYTLQEVAQIMKVNEMTVRRWIWDGKLKAHKPSKAYRITAEDLKEFIARNDRG